MPKCVAVWIDHDAARIFPIHADQFDRAPAVPPPQCVRPGRPPSTGGTHELFEEVAKALDGVEELLILGASKAKLDFLRYLHGHGAVLDTPRVVGIETHDPCSDGQLVAYAHRYFHP